MSKKIIGATVGTTISTSAINRKLSPVKFVNGVAPDVNGNVVVSGGGGGGGGAETDPTVYAWAKQPQKPTYTAQEVGALPADTVIPDDAHINELIDAKLAGLDVVPSYTGEVEVE